MSLTRSLMYVRTNLNVQNVLLIAASSLLLFGLCSFLKWYLQCRMKNKRIYRMLSHYKTPSYLPILGHSLKFIGTPTQIHKSIVRVCFKYGPNFVVWLLGKAMVVVGKPEDVEIVLQSQSCLGKNELYRFTRDVVGNGLFSAPPELWRRNRKIINPTFNGKILEGYQPIFCSTATIFVDEILPKQEKKKDVEWYSLFSSLNLDVIMQTAMGVNHDIQRKTLPFGEWLEGCMRPVFIRMLQFLYYTDFVFYKTSLGKLLEKSKTEIWEFTDKIIRARRKKFKEDLDNNKYQPVFDEDSSKPIGKKAFLDFLLELDHRGMKFSDKELRDEVTTFFVGGTDTTSVSSGFFLTMMGMHQDIQESVYQEIMHCLGPDGLPSVQELNDLQLMDRCLKETMRLFTPAPIVLRENSGCDLKISDGVIPVGVSVGVCFYFLHRSELYWEDPLKFNPDRFLPDQVAKRHPYTFLPFSAGLRGCIGQRFAFVNLKTLLALTLRKYKIHCDAYKSVEDIEVKNLMVLRPIHGFKFWIERRE